MVYLPMQDEQFLNNVIGQDAVKDRIKIYVDSFNETGEFPPVLLKAAKGSGKTLFAREVTKQLERSNSNVPFIEVNCATVKNAGDFLLQIYPQWKALGAMLFLDECHNLPIKLQELLLSICETSKQKVRKVTFNHREEGEVEYEFDFSEMSIMFATTDHHKMLSPLLDRLTGVSIAPYTEENLWDIFLLNLKCDTSSEIKAEILRSFRGHPRHCVSLANELDRFASAKKVTYINGGLWDQFCKVMGIFESGLEEPELAILKVLGSQGSCSLTALAAKTGYSRGVIKGEYELGLMQKGLMDIEGERKLTRKGNEYFLKHCC